MGLEGFLVSENEPSSAACTVDLLLADVGMRECMGMAGRKRAKANHAPEKNHEQLGYNGI